MTILLKEVEEMAKLARIKFNQEERKKLQKELDEIVIYMDKINELDLENVEPLTNMTNDGIIDETDENLI